MVCLKKNTRLRLKNEERFQPALQLVGKENRKPNEVTQ